MNGIRIGVPVKAGLKLGMIVLSASVGHGDAIPTAFDRNRYQATRTYSPFALAAIEEKASVAEAPSGVVCG